MLRPLYVLESLFARLAIQYALEPLTHASFIDGRSGKIKIENQEVGLIGEVHAKVLDAWQIGMPTVAFEISLEKLL